MMVPSGDPVDHTIANLEELLSPGDIIIDGGNSNYKDTIRRHGEVTAKGFHYVDCGTSGGVWGLKEGYSMMIGGDKEPVEHLRPICEALAPAPDKGWGHVGPSGAGHFVKMVHNGIEYGMMQAYAEGFTIMEKKEPLDLNLPQIARSGSMAPSSAPGCSTSPPTRWKRIPPSKASKPTSPTPAKAAGPSSKPSTSTSPHPSSPNPSSAASAPAKKTTSPTA